MELGSLEEIYESLYYGLGIAELGVAGIILMITIIGAIVGFVVSCVVTFVIWLVESIPTYKLAKKLDYQYAYLAWIPFFGSYFRLYVLTAMVGNKPFDLFDGKIKIQSRTMSFWCYVAIALFGGAIISMVIGILGFIPILGQIVSILGTFAYFLPPVATGLMQYVFIKDVLDLFKEDKKANRTAAIVITVLDSTVTFGLARAIYLWTITKLEPLPQQTVEAEQSTPC